MEIEREKIGKCRSCGKQIFFVPAVKSGRLMPLDFEPTDHGNVVLTPEGGRVLNEADRAAHQGTRYESHFATCPNAKQHREKKKKGA